MLFFFSSRRRHTRCSRDWSSDVCSSDLIKKRILHFDALDVRYAGRWNIHMPAGIDTVTMRPGAHSRSMDVVESLSNGDPFARVAAVEVSRAADKFQISRGRCVDVVVAAGSVDHFCHRLTYRRHEHVADARAGAAGRRIFAI